MTQAAAVKVLAAAIAVLMIASGVGLATVEEDTGAADLATAPSGEEAGSATPTTAPSSGIDGVPGGGEAAPAAASPAPSPAAAGAAGSGGGVDYNALPERTGPPRAGVYRYRSKFDGQASFGTFTTRVNEEQTSEVRFAPAAAPAGETRDRQSSEESGSSGGFNFSGGEDEERVWRADGMFVVSSNFSGESKNEEGGRNVSGECQWQPPLQELAFPLKVGATWSWDSTCQSESDNFKMRRHSQGNSKVTGMKTASVAGKEVRVFVIESRSTEEIDTTYRDNGQTYESKSRIDSESTDLYATSVALKVRSDAKAKGTTESQQAPGQQARFEGEGFSELLNLEPK